jgi:hypothetical protein
MFDSTVDPNPALNFKIRKEVMNRLLNVSNSMILMLGIILCGAKGTPDPAVVHETKDELSPSSEMEFLGPIIRHMIGDEQDPSVQIALSDENEAPFSIVAFYDIPEEPPYRLETRRILQEDPNLYIAAEEQQKVLNEIRSNGLKVPFGMLFQLSEYLPGERVTVRICSQDGRVLKQAICCPNPKILKNALGERIMEAAIVSINRPDTVYVLFFPHMNIRREYTLTSGNIQVKEVVPPGKLDCTTFAPEIEGMKGGVSKIEVRVGNESYEMELPWGLKLADKPETKELKSSYLLNDDVVSDLSVLEP